MKNPIQIPAKEASYVMIHMHDELVHLGDRLFLFHTNKPKYPKIILPYGEVKKLQAIVCRSKMPTVP